MNFLRRVFASLALVAAITLGLAAPAAAGPIPYQTTVFDSINNAINQAIQAVNNNVPTTAVLTTVTGSAGASTCNAVKCTITTESLATAASTTYTETVTDSQVAANSQVYCSVATAGTGQPVCAGGVTSAGSVVLKIQNVSTGAAFNNTLTIDLLVVN